MLLTDWLLLLTLTACLCARWWYARRGARWVAVFLALAAVLLGVWQVLNLRWSGTFGVVAGVAGLVACSSWCWPSRPRPVGSTLLLALPLCLLAGVLYSFPVHDLPRPSGAHPVGLSEFELVDTSRRGVLGSAPDAPRRLLIRVWYPAGEVEGLRRRPYFTDTEAHHTALGIGRLIGLPFLFQHLKYVDTWSYTGAPLVEGTPKLPVAIYSHGYTSFAWQHSALMETLASHGYLVFAVQHPRDASPTVYPDGSIEESRPNLVSSMTQLLQPFDAYRTLLTGTTVASRFTALKRYRQALDDPEHPAQRSAQVWLADRRFVLDSLQRGEVPPPVAAIAAAGDYRATAQLGMSFGGSTTAKLCFEDVRCAVAVNLDGADFHRLPLDGNIPVPLLMVYSDYDQAARELTGDPTASGHGVNDLLYENLSRMGTRNDIYRVKIRSARHIGISDFTWFARGPVRDRLFGAIEGGVMLPLQNALVLGFLDHYLRGKDNSFLEKTGAEFRPWLRIDEAGAVRRWARGNNAVAP